MGVIPTESCVVQKLLKGDGCYLICGGEEDDFYLLFSYPLVHAMENAGRWGCRLDKILVTDVYLLVEAC